VGSGHAPLALRADWQAQLQQCHAELGFRHVRFHALLSDEMGTLVCKRNKLLYSFFNVDQVMDFLLSIGMRPFVELSFMPETLASGSTKVFSYQANVTPPKNYRQWEELIHKLASHWVERYGREEVREWFFEVWNEPNLKAFWTGTQKEYFKLYKITAETLKRVDPLLRVGGPATAKNAWIPEFLDFCENREVPVDFVSTHHYPTDAFGKAGADTLSQLQHASPHVMRDDARKVRAQAKSLPVYYTEWNISSNPRDALHDEPFAAAYAAKIVLEARGNVQGYSYWTFSDIFNENYFPSVPVSRRLWAVEPTRDCETDLSGVRVTPPPGKRVLRGRRHPRKCGRLVGAQPDSGNPAAYQPRHAEASHPKAARARALQRRAAAASRVYRKNRRRAR
jgi:xylan 1,4-beta-xylosidase